jgi:hypothetical protein
MNKKDFLEILNLPVLKRYNYFIEKVAGFEEVWGLYDNNGWAMFINRSGHKMVPFWPNKIFAEICILNFGEEYRPEPIDIYKFIGSWLLELKENQIKPAIFYTPNKTYFKVNNDILINDIKSELYAYM